MAPDINQWQKAASANLGKRAPWGRPARQSPRLGSADFPNWRNQKSAFVWVFQTDSSLPSVPPSGCSGRKLNRGSRSGLVMEEEVEKLVRLAQHGHTKAEGPRPLWSASCSSVCVSLAVALSPTRKAILIRFLGLIGGKQILFGSEQDCDRSWQRWSYLF